MILHFSIEKSVGLMTLACVLVGEPRQRAPLAILGRLSRILDLQEYALPASALFGARRAALLALWAGASASCIAALGALRRGVPPGAPHSTAEHITAAALVYAVEEAIHRAFDVGVALALGKQENRVRFLHFYSLIEIHSTSNSFFFFFLFEKKKITISLTLTIQFYRAVCETFGAVVGI